MESFFALLALCTGNSPVTGEFPSQWPVTRSFYFSFDLRRNKRLSKQEWGWLFETPSHSLWRHHNCNEIFIFCLTDASTSHRWILDSSHKWPVSGSFYVCPVVQTSDGKKTEELLIIWNVMALVQCVRYFYKSINYIYCHFEERSLMLEGFGFFVYFNCIRSFYIRP